VNARRRMELHVRLDLIALRLIVGMESVATPLARRIVKHVTCKTPWAPALQCSALKIWIPVMALKFVMQTVVARGNRVMSAIIAMTA